MQALKQHYEKIALALLVFALLALSLYFVQQVREATERQGRLDEITTVSRRGNELEPLTEEAFQAIAMLQNPDVDWETSRGRGSIAYPGALIWCKADDCNYWLPVTEEYCPSCGTEQDVEDVEVVTGLDDDGDGIPNEIEDEFEFLDRNDYRDAQQDYDEDWFTNKEEIVDYKTDPADPSDHPPLAHKLAVLDIRRQRFEIEFSTLMGGPDTPKEEWDITLQVQENGRVRTRFVQIGETIKGYKIIDVNRKVVQVQSAAVNEPIARDVSELVLEAANGERITLQLKEQAYKGVGIRLFLNTDARNPRQGRTHNVRENEVLVLTDAVGNEERYTVHVQGPQTVLVRPEGAPDAPGILVEPPRRRAPREERGFPEAEMPPEFMPEGIRGPMPEWDRSMRR